jgi:glc operon protein GlcG
MSASVREASSPTDLRAVISSDGAMAVLRAVEAKAAEMQVPAVLAVVDDAGTLKAFLRMDGTPPGAVQWAIDKAVTAAAFRTPTHVLDEAMQQAASSALASFMAQPHVTLAPGGFPLLIDGGVVGAVGASGGSPEQDQQIAEAGVAAI